MLDKSSSSFFCLRISKGPFLLQKCVVLRQKSQPYLEFSFSPATLSTKCSSYNALSIFAHGDRVKWPLTWSAPEEQVEKNNLTLAPGGRIKKALSRGLTSQEAGRGEVWKTWGSSSWPFPKGPAWPVLVCWRGKETAKKKDAVTDMS